MNDIAGNFSKEVNRRSRWIALVVLIAAQFMVAIDVAGLNVALPSIQNSLDFTGDKLQWVISAYQILFGGFLLLGGRIADVLGRKRMFFLATGLFSLASLMCGLSWSGTSLIIFRAVQGLAAALLSPTSLALVTSIYTDDRDRNIALGIWGAVFGAGGAIGSLISGAITTGWGWSWFFFINVPIGILVLLVGPRLIKKDASTGEDHGFDLAGATTLSIGMMLLLYAITMFPQFGLQSHIAIFYLLASLASLVIFVIIEHKTKHPLLPQTLFTKPTVRAGAIAGIFSGSCHFSLFYLLSLYMQDVLHYSALTTSFAYIAPALSTIIFANLASKFVHRFGAERVLIIGQVLEVLAFVYYMRLPANGTYFIDLLPALIIGGIGWGLIFPSINIISFTGFEDSDTGIVSGVVNMSEQFGGSVGITIVAITAATVTNKYMQDYIGAIQNSPDSLTIGFRAAFMVLTILAVFSVVCSLLLLKTRLHNHDPIQQNDLNTTNIRRRHFH